MTELNVVEEATVDSAEDKTPILAEDPERATGVIYLASIPPRFTKRRINEYFSNFGQVGRIYLQIDRKSTKVRKYTEGWVEFKKKKIAKKAALMLNKQQVGGKHRSPAFDCLWTIKYLHGFKWSNLVEQLNYERNIEDQRLRIELAQARNEGKHFVEQVEKSGRIRNLEKTVSILRSRLFGPAAVWVNKIDGYAA
uniref:Activator of basal transcription 1 n=1 Tax=Bursaphelenchus xylophilus TaxID=6326 RepID=A0A1I7S753_BURXY